MTKIIFFIEAPFSERKYGRYGIELLQKNGFEVEVWDFIPFLHPCLQVAAPDINFSGYRKFQRKQDALAAIVGLDRSCFVMCLLPYKFRSYPVYRALSKRKIRYGIVLTNMVPVASLVRDPRSVLDLLRKSSLTRLFRLLFRLIPFQFVGVRPASVVLAGGMQSLRSRLFPKNGETLILWTHLPDYDVYLNEREKPVQEENNLAVFLDEYLPFHPDYLKIGMPPPSGPDSYFPALRRLFDAIERDLKIKIVIAAHPSSDYANREKHPDYFGGRQIVKGKSLELIRKARFVIAHESTVLNFAVLFNKPVLFVTTDEIERNPREARFIHAMAGWLNKAAINADAPLDKDWEKALTVDEGAYARYREAFIKKSGSPEKSRWQILADYLKASEA